MSPDNTPPTKTATTKDHENNQQGSGSGGGGGGSGGGGRKTSSSTTTTRSQEHGVKCPRCDSPNTKFCYYNNYSLTQPRHFCKTCRRYWTKGGALRNVPIGGGCRKKHKLKSSRISCDYSGGSSSSDQFNGLKFLHGLSPSVDFHHHLAGLPFPRLQLHHHQITSPSIYNNIHFSSFGETSSAPPHNLDPSSVAMNYPVSSGYNGANAMNMNMNIHSHNNLASSIESLSSMNQDLHWKLQQQRLSMLVGGENQKENSNSVSLENENNQSQKPQPILFQNLEVTKPGGIFSVGNSRKEDTSTTLPTEWFFGNSYGSSVTPTPTASSGGPGPTHDNATNWNGGGVHAWGDVQQQYSSLP